MATPQTLTDPFSARDTFDTGAGKAGIYRLSKLETDRLTRIDALPYSLRVLLESLLRNCDGYVITEEDVKNLARWQAEAPASVEIPFKPARVVLQDFTGVPSVVDLAAMRSAMQRMGGDPAKINPLVPADLVVDHSVQVDSYGSGQSLEKNIELEFLRNRERYEFLRWGQEAFDNFRVVPPGTGIVHQVNLEYLAKCVFLREDYAGPVAVPDSLVGTDSHTTMIDGLGVVGWGVGGIEAEGVMLGQPVYMLMPEVVGMRVTGQLPAGTTATDMVLLATEILRAEGVVGKFVEFFGPGVSTMGLADRATIANMSPEYGATMGYFPIDAETLRYLRRTGRSDQEVELVERYTKEQGLFRTDQAPVPTFTRVIEFDLSKVEPSLAGPKRPQDRVPLSQMQQSFHDSLAAPVSQRGFALDGEALKRTAQVAGIRKSSKGDSSNGDSTRIGHGAIAIAAITSCTNTSNPSVMVAAGLVARKAVALGLTVPAYVKTSLAPGSRVVTEYLRKAGLDSDLDKIGFNTVGYGCTTCIGNSGPLPKPVHDAIHAGNLVAAGVLSGNRNFEGRISPDVKANYLASPPLVVAYALAGTTDIDLIGQPLGQVANGTDQDGEPVFLQDIWPTAEEVRETVEACVLPEMFREQYDNVWQKNPRWNAIEVSSGKLYAWQEQSTYIQEPPFLVDLSPEPQPMERLSDARCLALLGDSVTTDHISPAGAIATDSPAGKFLRQAGVRSGDFNSYGSRRGNDRVMTRGTLANIRIRNQLAPGTEGGVTRHLPDGATMSIYDAAMQYRQEGVPLVILAGREYGTGSSRDWAAKGTFLLGVRAVIASSYERIHRSNLVGMGVLPLEFEQGITWQSLGLSGEEIFSIPDLNEDLQPRQMLTVVAKKSETGRKEIEDATSVPPAEITFQVQVRIDTPVELDYYRNGGILQTVLRKLLKE